MVFLQAWAVTLFLDTQKKSVRGKSGTMESADLERGDPVSAADRHCLHLRQHNTEPDTTICSHFPATGAFPKSVISTNIVILLRLHAVNLGFQCLGF